MAAAAAVPLVSLYEYLHSDYQPDMDYVDGVLEERNLGEHSHSDLQTKLAVLFRIHRKEWQVKTYVEHRVQVSPTRFRVPDVCVMPATWKATPIIIEPPLLCIEVVSPEDRFSRIRSRCQDYFSLGVPVAWVFDPEQREVLELKPDGSSSTHTQGSLRLEGTPIEVYLAAIFAVLDEE